MKIQDVEVLTSLDRATIRFYEKEQILTPERSENGYRNYTDTDILLLLKIKLLRKLGIGIPAIKALQKGSENLCEVLTLQLEALTQQIQEDVAARGTCERILEDRVDYDTLDSGYYLEILSNLQISPEFKEEMSTEKHPVRRYIARTLDASLFLALMLAFLVMIVRIRPFSNFAIKTLVPMIATLLWMPTEALLLHVWGTTPGKWLMGIKLEDPNGGKLSFMAALQRSWDVFAAGYGFHIPIFALIRLYISYRSVESGKGTEWEDEAEIQYADPTTQKVVLTVIAFIAALALNTMSILDAELPKYRSKSLTMEQFVSNYHDYEQIFENENTMVLQADGTWAERTNYNVEIIEILDPYHERKDFTYTFSNNGSINTIEFEDRWEDVPWYMILPDYCRTALYTAVASRPGASVNDLQSLDQAIYSAFGTSLEKGGKSTGSFTICDVTFNWTAELPEGTYIFLYETSGTLFEVSDDLISQNSEQKTMPYSLEFVITIG